MEIRACAPRATFLEGHVALMRPDAVCDSGMAYDGGALALVGTVAFATLLAWGSGAGAFLAVGAVVARASRRIGSLLSGARPFGLMRHAPVAWERRVRTVVTTAPAAGRPHWVSLAVVGWRGPPVAV